MMSAFHTGEGTFFFLLVHIKDTGQGLSCDDPICTRHPFRSSPTHHLFPLPPSLTAVTLSNRPWRGECLLRLMWLSGQHLQHKKKHVTLQIHTVLHITADNTVSLFTYRGEGKSNLKYKSRMLSFLKKIFSKDYAILQIYLQI